MNAELKRRFNTVVFVGGPLDGVCWPCILQDPLNIDIALNDGKVYWYAWRGTTEYKDGTFEYKMVLVN